MDLILASNSPRRRELLLKEGIAFEVIPSQYREILSDLPPQDTVLKFAEGKAGEVFARFPSRAVLGADTVVALGENILGKPKDEEDAARMLRALSGRTHSVFTGVCLLLPGRSWKGVAETKVEFFDLTEKLIEEYIRTRRPLDKAGAYGIQDGYPLVRRIEGSYTNVVGLPVELVREYLNEAKIC